MKINKDKMVNIVIFIVFLIPITYYIWIETWLLPVKIIIFALAVLTLRSVLFQKK